MDWLEADLHNWDKNYRKSKETTKIINNLIITQREKELYLDLFGKFPEEYPEGSEGQLEWDYPNSKESKEYVKKLTEANETHSSKNPSRSKKKATPAKNPPKWKPPEH